MGMNEQFLQNRLYSHATEPDPGVEYKATLSLNEDGSGMKLENLERV